MLWIQAGKLMRLNSFVLVEQGLFDKILHLDMLPEELQGVGNLHWQVEVLHILCLVLCCVATARELRE